ncbi:MAG: Uma2 family endonuclease [Lutispora sp.]|nr:Uma2 family endonuclease [Lutispora sp.]
MVTKLENSRQKYTYQDYKTWPDDERWEIIDGEAYNMSPAPRTDHQNVSMELSLQFGLYLRDKPCQVFAAPYDVMLDEDKNNSQNIVQPDLLVVCDKKKLESGKYCFGAPDLIIEILSPSTAKKDLLTKRNLYEKFGVKEYWIADPEHKDLTVFLLQDDGKYSEPKTYRTEEKVTPFLFPDLQIDQELVYREI